jgi:hypothetical protein
LVLWDRRRCAFLLPALSAFNRNKPITPQLTKVLEELAQTGRSRFDWTQMKALIGAQIIQVCNEYNAAQPDVGALTPPSHGLVPECSLHPPAWARRHHHAFDVTTLAVFSSGSACFTALCHALH